MKSLYTFFMCFYVSHIDAVTSETSLSGTPYDIKWKSYVEYAESKKKTKMSPLNQKSDIIGEHRHFPCQTFRSKNKATSVHKLTPGDIKVVGAMGDSITAGNGIRAKSLIRLLTEYRGYSWSVGGKESYEFGAITLPNIIKKYNVDLTGYATSDGGRDSADAHLNVAYPGSVSSQMPEQARLLIKRLKEDQTINYEEDWKMITIFIGGNDLCDSCNDKVFYDEKNYYLYMKAALDILYAEVPKAFINVVPPVDMTEVVAHSKGVACYMIHRMLCSCAMKKERKEAISYEADQYTGMLWSLVYSGMYDKRDDFTVEFQPFVKEASEILNANDGKPDYSYLAPDCFHLSQKGHNTFAANLWNNLFLPPNSKKGSQYAPKELYCPKKNEHFRTRKNSKVLFSSHNYSTEKVVDHDENHSMKSASIMALCAGVLLLTFGSIFFIYRRYTKKNVLEYEVLETKGLLHS